jgi:hypothetical protein
MDDYVPKPLHEEDIERALQRVVWPAARPASRRRSR